MTPRFTRHAGAAIAVALHAAAGVALLNYEPARAALLAAAPIMVALISPPPILPAEQKQEVKPKPRPIAKRPKPVEPPPVLAAPAEAPSPVVVAPPPPAQPAPEPVVVAPPPPLPVTQPVFDADYLENPAPPYPQFSRRTREEGRVILRVLVNPRGSAEEVQVRTSSGHPRLDDSARDTVRRWKFIPAKRGAEPIAAWVLVPISFGLDS
jgi:protein TonB